MSALTLVLGERADFVFRYAEADGSPIIGASVSFALEGRAQDSTLAQIAAVTDEAGRARGTVIAGRTATAFRVRASAERAASAYVDVAVGDRGFGTLEVSPAYLGMRAIMSRVVDVYAEIPCTGIARAAASDRSAVLDPGDTFARFRALPVGLTYAIRGRALGAMGRTLAEGCVDGVAVGADLTTMSTITMMDVPLDSTGFYRADVVVDDTAPAATAGNVVRTAGLAQVSAAGGDAALLLDAVESWLREAGRDAEADTLAAARAGDGVDRSLDMRLMAVGAGPESSVEELAALLARRMDVAQVGGALSLGAAGPASSPATWTDTTLSLGSGDMATPLVAMDLAALRIDPRAMVTITARVGTSERVSLDSLTLSLPLGTLARELLDAVAREGGGLGIVDLLMERGGCDELERFATEDPALVGCDSRCANAACKQALEAVAGDISLALTGLDTARARLSLSGTLSMEDRDGDARAESLASTDLVGAWTPVDGSMGDTVTATASANAIPPLP